MSWFARSLFPWRLGASSRLRGQNLRRIACLLLLAVGLAGCDLPGQPDPADRPEPPSADLNFTSLFSQNCAGCHGAEGRLGPAPPLNDRLFLTIAPEAELLRVIEQGRAGTPMPAFAESHGGTLTSEQVRVLAQGLPKQWLPQGSPDAKPPPYAHAAQGDAARGAEVFARACAECHAADSPASLDHRSFLTLISDQALRRVIITGRPDLGMPDYADGTGRPDDFQPLDSQQIEDLVALLAAWRQGRAPGPETTP